MHQESTEQFTQEQAASNETNEVVKPEHANNQPHMETINYQALNQNLANIYNHLYKLHTNSHFFYSQNIDSLLTNIDKTIRLINSLKCEREQYLQQIQNFTANCNHSQQQIEALKYDCNILHERNKKLERDIQLQMASRIRQENQILKAQHRELLEKNTHLHKERDALVKEREQLLNERGSLLSELASEKRDKTTTYIGGEDSIPQHHLLYQQFKQIKQQDFNKISSDLFRYLSETNPSLKENRKQVVAKIKSILSQEVMISGIKLFYNNSDISSKHTNAVKAFKEALYNTLNINSNALIQAFDNEIDNLIKQAITLADETINISIDAWSNQEYSQAIKDISQSIYSALQMPEEFLIPEAIRNETENLVRKGLELVKKIASADPSTLR